MSNRFSDYAQAPPTAEEWQRREEDIERQQERRLLAADLAYEYPEDWVEIREFTGKWPGRAEKMQGELDFGEVA